MKRILVGVDESEESRLATSYAARLAKATGSELLIAAVVHVPAAFDSPELVDQVTRWRQEETERVTGFVRGVAAAVAGSQLTVQTLVASGSPAETLAEVAAASDVEMVVVGHRGRGAIKRMLVGSVADRLMQICPKPVLVVR